METTLAPLERIRRKYVSKYQVEFDDLVVDGQSLRILGIANMAECLERLAAAGKLANPLLDLPLWAKVWPASIVLGRYIRNHAPQGKTMLEIGAGSGVCSLVASRYGFAKITLTDVNGEALDFARANVEENGLASLIEVRRLDVAEPGLILPEKFDFICASEVLYLPALHRPLLRFVERNLARGGKAFFCVDLGREKKQFEKMAAACFHVQSGCIGVKSHDETAEKRSVYKIIILEAR